MKMQNGLSLYAKSMGKIFRVRHIALTDAEANHYCKTHNDTGVIAEDTEKHLIFIADIYGSVCPSAILEDK